MGKRKKSSSTSKNIISILLISSLSLIFVASLIAYYSISKSPRFEDLFISLAATVLGIFITLLLVNKSIQKQETLEWNEFRTIVSNEIIDFLFSLSQYLNLNPSLAEQWIKIFNENIEKKEKVNKLISFSIQKGTDENFIREITKDDHLIEFFSNGYNRSFKRLDDLFRLYNHQLSPEQSSLIIKLKTNISSLIRGTNHFKMINVAFKELVVNIEGLG